MLTTRSTRVWRLATRSHFTADPARSPQTELVLLHAGQPWNEFHAREFLRSRPSRWPKFWNSLVADGKMKQEVIKGSIGMYKDRESLETQTTRLSERIEESLDTVVPEFGPFKVSRLFRFDEIPFEKQLQNIQSRRPQRLIFMPLYPHFSPESENLLVETAKFIEKSSAPMMEGNREVISRRIETNSDYSYDVQAIWRWDNHSILADYWSSKLKQVPDIEAVVFTAPSHFSCSYGPIHATCERTMNQLGDAIPWKLSFFPTWTSWDLMPMWRRGVASEVEKWKKRRIAVVPITEVMETFDTNYTIPRKVRHLKNAVVVHPDQESEKLVHGLTEIVKNSLLGKRDRQLEVTATPRNLQYLSLFLD